MVCIHNIYNVYIHDWNMTEWYLFLGVIFYFCHQDIVSVSLLFSIQKYSFQVITEFTVRVLLCSTTYILDSSSSSMTNAGSSSDFVKPMYLCFKIVIQNTNMHLYFSGVCLVAQLNLMLMEINNIFVVISFFVLSQTSRDSSVLPLPKLYSSH